MTDETVTPVDALELVEIAVDDPETVGMVLSFLVRCETKLEIDNLAKRLWKDTVRKNLSETDLNVIKSLFADARRALVICPNPVNGSA